MSSENFPAGHLNKLLDHRHGIEIQLGRHKKNKLPKISHSGEVTREIESAIISLPYVVEASVSPVNSNNEATAWVSIKEGHFIDDSDYIRLLKNEIIYCVITKLGTDKITVCINLVFNEPNIA